MSDTELMKIFTNYMENLQLTKSKPEAYLDSKKIYFKNPTSFEPIFVINVQLDWKQVIST
jgi:hypothetical protein